MCSMYLMLAEFYKLQYGLPWGLRWKESACNAGDIRNVGLIPGLGRSPEEGNGN